MRSRNDLLNASLTECIDMLMSGAGTAACLERFPEHAAELEPLLETIVRTRELRPVPARLPEVAAQSRAAYMTAVLQLQEQRAVTPQIIPWWRSLLGSLQFGSPQMRPTGLFAILLILIISGIVISGSVTLAAGALPGDFLYGVKTTSENVRMFLTLNKESRDELRAVYGQRRIDEARAVVDGRRTVDNLILQGTIESLDATEWIVSRLRVMVDENSQVKGEPVVGASVDGLMRAPGDGRLLLLYAEVRRPESNAEALALPSPTAAPTATQMSTPAPSPTSTPEPTRPSVLLPGLTPVEPTDAPPITRTPTATASATRMPTSTRTSTATTTPTTAPTLTATATWTLQPPRQVVKKRVEGRLTAMNGNVWTVNGTEFEVTGETSITGGPVIGAVVSCELQERPGARPLALSIVVTAPPEATPEPFEFVDFIKGINGSSWAIGDYSVKVTGDTELVNDPGVGDRADVKARRQANGEIWATSITALRETEVLVDGIIEAFSGNSITVGGHEIAVTSETTFVGTPVAGQWAQVLALQMSNGSLIAKIVVVIEPTVTPTEAPTATPTETPTATTTIAPTDTATTQPTVTPTP